MPVKTEEPVSARRPQPAERTVRAAVVRHPNDDFEFADLQLSSALRPEEILVRVVATGVCQTDLHVRAGAMGTPFPAVLGHEGAGLVEAVGDGVSDVRPGDRVVMSFDSCGACKPCRTGHQAYCAHSVQLNFGGARIDGTNALHDNHDVVHGHFFGQSSFASMAVASRRNVVVVGDDVPLERLAPLGCGIQTGAGAVLNSLQVRPGASLAVFGAGAVGLAAIMAAKIAGASTVIAVDVLADRLELARELGATHGVDASGGGLVEALAAIAPGGLDYVIEITGRPEMLNQAVDALAPLGTAALVGGSPQGTTAPIHMNALLGGRTVRGVAQGDSVPQVFIPQLIELHRQGRLPYDRLVTYYPFERLNEALADMRAGRVIKPVLRMPSHPDEEK